MNEYKVMIEYGYHGIFSTMTVVASSAKDAIRTAIAEGVPASFAFDERMMRLSVSLELDGVCCNQTNSDCKPSRVRYFKHTPADSWEKLEEDVNLGCRDYCKKHRLEECDYNMRMHLLARAKKLAGVEDEAI